jgi:hypothetical protein
MKIKNKKRSKPKGHNQDGGVAVMEPPAPIAETPAPENLVPATVETWAVEGKKWVGKLDECKFEIGDWLCVGEKQFKKKAFGAAEIITGYAKASLRELARVSAATPAVVRTTFPELNWEHFRAVSYRLIPVNEKEGWLTKAVAETLSAAQLKAAIRVKDKPATTLEEKKVVSFFISDEGFETLQLLTFFRVRGNPEASPQVHKNERDRICVAALQDYFSQPKVAEEIENARACEDQLMGYKEMNKEIKARASTPAWKSIDELLSSIVAATGDAPDPRDFAKEWERQTGLVFTRQKYQSALKRSKVFVAHYGRMDAEDFGLPQIKTKEKKVRASKQFVRRGLSFKEKFSFITKVNAVVARCKTAKEFPGEWQRQVLNGVPMSVEDFKLALSLSTEFHDLPGKAIPTAEDFGFAFHPTPETIPTPESVPA